MKGKILGVKKRVRWGIPVYFFCLFFVFFSAPFLNLLADNPAGTAFAATQSAPLTLIVDSTADAVDANPGDGICDDGSGNCTLRAAVMEANASISADTITLPAGTYTISIANSTSDENGALEGDLDITDDLTINGAGAATTIIDGGGIDRLLHINPCSTGSTVALSVSLADLTIQNGDVGSSVGGGIFDGSFSDTLSLGSCAITGNRSSGSGGGISSSGTLNVTGGAITGNTSTGGKGGGISGVVLNLTSTSVTKNSSKGDGAGIHTTGTTTITGATITGNSTTSGRGAAVGVRGPATITDSDLSNNTASSKGGATFNHDSLSIINCTLNNNSSGSKGGAIYQDEDGDILIKNSTFDGNKASGDGGAIYYENDDRSPDISVDMLNTVVSNNSSGGDGGGIYFDNSHGHMNVVIDGNTITKNHADFDGGGMYIEDIDRNMIIRKTSITDNSAGVTGSASLGDGGGIYNEDGDDIDIFESTISGNSATGNGGGVYNTESMEFVNSTISGNKAGGNGGGMHLDKSYATNQTNLFNVTISDNTADSDDDGVGSGGGIFHQINQPGSPVSIQNSLVAGNFTKTTHDGADPDCAGEFTSGGFNLIGDIGTTCTGVTGGANGDIVNVQPRLGPLADNGASTLTHALKIDSPAVDAGNPAGCLDNLGATLATDQRGGARPKGNGCDMGAFEWHQYFVSSNIALVYPEDGDADIGTTATFIWKKASTTDGSNVSYSILYCADKSFSGCAPVSVTASGLTALNAVRAGGLAGLMLFGFAFTCSSNRNRMKRFVMVCLLVSSAGLAISCGGALTQGAPSADRTTASVKIVLPDAMSLQADGKLNSGNPRLQGVTITDIAVTVTGEDMDTIAQTVPLNTLEAILDVPAGKDRTFTVAITGSKGEVFSNFEVIDLVAGVDVDLPITVSLIPGIGVDEISFTVGGLSSDTTYYWKIVAVDRAGKTIESKTQSFKTAMQ